MDDEEIGIDPELKMCTIKLKSGGEIKGKMTPTGLGNAQDPGMFIKDPSCSARQLGRGVILIPWTSIDYACIRDVMPGE